MYKVEQDYTAQEDYNTLYIKDDSGERLYSDYCEPEDNSFYRDYKWIKEELEKAYSQGRKDANTERDAEDKGSTFDAYQRLYYPSSVAAGPDDVQSVQERTTDWLK